MEGKHMELSHLHQQIQKIKEDLLKMGGLVEEALNQSVQSISDRDDELAKAVIANDTRIDDLENSIDQRCVELLATQQPVAVDLRFLTSALRICSILERIGDQSVNLAERALVLNECPPFDSIPPKLLEMVIVAKEMTRKCLDSFVQRNLDMAADVRAQDDVLDELYRSLLEEMIIWMMKEQRVIRRGVEIILAARHLERVGDQATNVAEAVIFMVKGQNIRHKADSFKA